MNARRPALLVAALALLLTGCGSDTADTPPATEGAPTGAITVFAAASLKGTFTALGEKFMADHPGTTVTFSFAGSGDLLTQITGGAPADVFASADTRTMTTLADASLLASAPVDFATNRLTIVTAPGNPLRIRGFADLTDPDLLVVTCAPQVPCGAATTAVEGTTGTELTPVSEESSVTDVLNKVVSGQADAGLVYVTDATAAGAKVTAVDFPEASSAVNTYPIAAVVGTRNPVTAEAFIAAVADGSGRRILADAGFGPVG